MDFKVTENMILTQFFVLMLAFSCSVKQKDTTNSQVKINQTKSVDLCELEKSSLNTILETTLSKPDLIMSSIKSNPNDEKCLFAVIDKLSLLSESSQKQLKALEKLNDISDGFISEYFIELCVGLFKKNLAEFSNFLFENQSSSLANSLVEGFSMEISMAKDRDAEKNKLINATVDKMRSLNYSAEQIHFIKALLQKIDPSLFD